MAKTSNHKNSIVVPISFSDAVMKELHADYNVLTCALDPLSNPSKMIALCDGAFALCPVFYQKIDANLIQALPSSVKLIASFGVGTNHIDLAAAHAKAIQVSNTPEVVTNDTADITLGLIIASMRGFYKSEKDLRENKWGAPSLFARMGQSLSGKTLCIIGLGRIGEAVAKRATAFEMKVIYFSRTRRVDIEDELGIEYMPTIKEALVQSDVISLHCDLNDDTRHIIDAEALSYMKPSATLINAGRGPLIDETALVSALKEKSIAAAGLDVFEFEPKVTADLLKMHNVTLLPHIGTATVETRDAMGRRVKSNLDHFIKTGQPIDLC